MAVAVVLVALFQPLRLAEVVAVASVVLAVLVQRQAERVVSRLLRQTALAGRASLARLLCPQLATLKTAVGQGLALLPRLLRHRLVAVPSVAVVAVVRAVLTARPLRLLRAVLAVNLVVTRLAVVVL